MKLHSYIDKSYIKSYILYHVVYVAILKGKLSSFTSCLDTAERRDYTSIKARQSFVAFYDKVYKIAIWLGVTELLIL